MKYLGILDTTLKMYVHSQIKEKAKHVVYCGGLIFANVFKTFAFLNWIASKLCSNS